MTSASRPKVEVVDRSLSSSNSLLSAKAACRFQRCWVKLDADPPVVNLISAWCEIRDERYILLKPRLIVTATREWSSQYSKIYGSNNIGVRELGPN